MLGRFVVFVATRLLLIKNCTFVVPLHLTQKVLYEPSATAATPVSVIVPTEEL